MKAPLVSLGAFGLLLVACSGEMGAIPERDARADTDEQEWTDGDVDVDVDGDVDGDGDADGDPPPPEPDCRNSVQCEEVHGIGWECIDGLCKLPCTYDWECAAGCGCVDGFCTEH